MREFGGGGATWVGAAAPTYANHRRFLGLRDPSDRGISQGAFLSGAGGRMRVWVRACARVCARLWQYLLLRPRSGRGNARIFAVVFSRCCAFSRGRAVGECSLRVGSLYIKFFASLRESSLRGMFGPSTQAP